MGSDFFREKLPFGMFMLIGHKEGTWFNKIALKVTGVFDRGAVKTGRYLCL